MSMWRRGALSLLPRVGLSWTDLDDGVGLVARPGRRARVQPISEDAWLVQSPVNPEDPLILEELDKRSWILQRRQGGRMVQPIGRKNLRTQLLVDLDAARQHMRGHQMALGRYLAGEHIAWILRGLRMNCLLDVGGKIGDTASGYAWLATGGASCRSNHCHIRPHACVKLRMTTRNGMS